MSERSRIITLGSRVRLRLAADDRLVTLVRAGEQAAFEAIYERHAKELLGFCVYMLGSRQDAEDAVQATFTSAYRALRAGRRAVALRPWLFTIARNESLSLLRARRTTVELNGELAPGADPLGRVEIREEVREMLEALRGLPERQRAALVLAELHGLSQVEIAAVLGVRPEQVKAYVYQARSNLISERRARDADCREIREELALARGAALLKGRLRRHVRSCAGCRTYAAGVNRQRQFLGALLPFTPPLALKFRALQEALGAGAGAGDPATYAGGAALAGSAVVSGSVATTAVDVAAGGINALGVKVVAGVAALGASVGVGASMLSVAYHPSPVRAGVTSTATAGSQLPLTASALDGGSTNAAGAGPQPGTHATGGASRQRGPSSTARSRSRARMWTRGEGGVGGRPQNSGGGSGSAIREPGGGSSPGTPSEAQGQAREAHPSKSSQSQPHEHNSHQGGGEHPPRSRVERRQLQEEHETQRAQAKVQREQEHEEHQRSRTRAPRSEEEREQARKRREERRQEREPEEEREDGETNEPPPSEGE